MRKPDLGGYSVAPLRPLMMSEIASVLYNAKNGNSGHLVCLMYFFLELYKGRLDTIRKERLKHFQIHVISSSEIEAVAASTCHDDVTTDILGLPHL